MLNCQTQRVQHSAGYLVLNMEMAACRDMAPWRFSIGCVLLHGPPLLVSKLVPVCYMMAPIAKDHKDMPDLSLRPWTTKCGRSLNARALTFQFGSCVQHCAGFRHWHILLHAKVSLVSPCARRPEFYLTLGKAD